VKKRILQLIATVDGAAAAKQMGLLARGLPPEDFDVHVCVLGQGGPLLSGLLGAGIPVTVISSRWQLDLQAAWLLQRHLARLRPDLIHCWLLASAAYGCAAAMAAGVKCLPQNILFWPRLREDASKWHPGVTALVASRRCLSPWRGWLELAVDRQIARRCDQIVTSRLDVRDLYVRRGVPAAKIRVIPDGVPRAQPSGATRRQLLAELGLPEDARLIGVVGRLLPRKRIKDAIWAADLLKVVRDDVHLLVVGDGPHRQRLLRFREQVLIRDKVHFLGHRNDLPHLLPHLQVLWSTSAYEGQPSAVMEAMAAAVPVVATDVRGNRELVIPETTGYLVPVGARAAFAGHTNKLLDDPSLAKRLGQAAQERIQREFTVEKMVQQYTAMYHGLLA
jgi:glycosyltransferase involved in cell wall biosynthesis